MSLPELFDHPLYIHQDSIEKSDAVAFAFVNKEKTVFFPYKQTELLENELRANILYAGLCLSDSHTARSKWGPCNYPIAPGHEIIGEVSEVGSKVTNFKKGDKVAFGTIRACCQKCEYCTNRKEPLCQSIDEEKFTYGYHWGGYSTQLQQPADFFIPIPEGLDLKKSAPLLCAGITVYNPINQYAKPNTKVCVIGIGGLGHLAVQFLAKMGCEVTAVTNSMEKEKAIRELGAHNVILIKDKKNFTMYHDFVINTLPVSDNFEEYLSLSKPGTVFCQVGVPDISEKISFCVNYLVINEIHLVGSIVGSRDDIKDMLKLCVEKNIYPYVEEFPFEEFDKALHKLEHGKPIFRCVVNVEEYSKKKGLFK
jgi:uncharacterized zinc-type alcohol dehydrogenase-like protein